MSKSYGQFCPVATAAEVFCERWNALIIRELVSGSETFNDIRMGVTRVSPSLLSSRLKALERAGVIDREKLGGKVRYQLTQAGRELRPLIMELGIWGQRWARSDLSESHLDPGYLVWDIRRRIDLTHFPARRTVVRFEFTEFFGKQRFWWLVINNGEVDLCRTDPGYEIDLAIASPLKLLTQVWMGDVELSRALAGKGLGVTGDVALRNTMGAWFTLSVVADIGPCGSDDGQI